MIDKPVAPTGVLLYVLPLVRAVIDSVSEGIVILTSRAAAVRQFSARRVIDGQNGDVRNRLQSLGARFSPLKNGARVSASSDPSPAGPLTLAERERQAIIPRCRTRAASWRNGARLGSAERRCGDASSRTGWTLPRLSVGS